MPFLSKYGVARHIYIAIPKAGSANHAVSGDYTPAAGDVKISKDGGATANVTNLPTAIAMGNSAIWDFSLTATEMQAAQIVVTVADSATKAVDDTGFIIETYGNASAQHELDIDGATVAANVTQYNGVNATSSSGRPEVNATHLAGTAYASADLSTTMKASVNAEVVDCLNVDTYAEPGQEAPVATVSLVKKIGYLYKFLRNRKTQTSTTLSVYADDASTVDQKATISDNGTVYDHGEIAAGP